MEEFLHFYHPLLAALQDDDFTTKITEKYPLQTMKNPAKEIFFKKVLTNLLAKN